MVVKRVIKNVVLSVLQNLKNVPGWKTDRKILVIESDDWGSIRIPSRGTYESFKKQGFPVQDSQYNRYDSLESNDDMEALLSVLTSIKNSNGRSPKITANAIMANPDFEKIRESNFEEYHYEEFTDTLRRYPGRDNVLSLMREGIANGLLQPQFHGREHVNVYRWINALRSGDRNTKFCFDHGTTYSGMGDYSYMETFDMDSPLVIDDLRFSIADGLNIFHNIFGFRSTSFIAPCYTWDSTIEPALTEAGIRYMQGGRYQFIPRGGFNNYKTKYRIIGRSNKDGLVDLVRNTTFEPSLVRRNDWVDYALRGIESAFRWGKPAILCTHRLNFIGSIDESNRTENLKLFRQLLYKIVSRWPMVEFMSSDEVGDLITKNGKH